MIDFEKTIISQFANSPTIVQLVTNMNGYIDQTANFDNFYDFVWNVNTAQGFGLDVWGKIVEVSRNLQISTPPTYFGFQDGANDYAPFDQAPFYNGPLATQTYVLPDDAYRVLILTKALANISATTSPALNQLLRNLFPGRGRTYVNDMGLMQMRYVFEFNLTDVEFAILTQSGALPHPAGVAVTIFQIDPVHGLFGFSEAGYLMQPFGQGVFANY